MQLEVSVLSDRGGRDRNEDAYGVWSSDGGCFCVVSDGAGGHAGGDTASKLAVRTILATFQDHPVSSASAVESALGAAHAALIEQQAAHPQLQAMRATATVLAVDILRHTAAWGHVGDTRLYGFRNRRVVAQTKDHSIVQKMVDAGFVAPDALRESAQRSRLFAALGHAECHAPTVGESAYPLAAGDAFLLCTDGFWEHIDEAAMERSLATAASAADWLRTMEQEVVAAAGPDQDNFSALAVWCSNATPGAPASTP